MYNPSTTRSIPLPGSGNEDFFMASSTKVSRRPGVLEVVVGGDIDNLAPEFVGTPMVTLRISTPEGWAGVVLHTEDALRIGQALIAYADRAGAR